MPVVSGQSGKRHLSTGCHPERRECFAKRSTSEVDQQSPWRSRSRPSLASPVPASDPCCRGVFRPMNDELWMEEALRCCPARPRSRAKFRWEQWSCAEDASSAAAGIAISPTPTPRPTPRSSPCAKPVQRSATIAWPAATCLLQLNRAPMCAGALVHARIKRLVYGAEDPKAGAVHSVMQVLNHPQLNHQMEVRSGVLAGRCADCCKSSLEAVDSRRVLEPLVTEQS